MIRLRALALIAGLSLAGQEQPKIFRITPVRPVAELRTEALALKPPAESGDFRPPDLVDVPKLDARPRQGLRDSLFARWRPQRAHVSVKTVGRVRRDVKFCKSPRSGPSDSG